FGSVTWASMAACIQFWNCAIGSAARSASVKPASVYSRRRSTSDMSCGAGARAVGSGGNHAAFAGEVEQPAGVHHRADFPERFEGIHFSRGFHGHGGFIEIHSDDVAGFQDVTKAVGDFTRIKFSS